MKVDNFSLNGFSPEKSLEAKNVSAGFSRLFESSLSKAEKKDKAFADCADSVQNRFVTQTCELVDAGVISLKSPTVSHLLINHPEYGSDCWKIVHSDLNRNKPYRRIPAGTRIYIDPQSKEITWNNSRNDRAGLRSDKLSPAGESAPKLRKTEYDSYQHLKSSGLSYSPKSEDALLSNGGKRKEEQKLINDSISKAAAKYNLPTDLIESVIRAESDFQVRAVSEAGARGLMQLMPETAKELGVSNPFDIEENIDGGARYLKKMLDTFEGDLTKALAAYNAGPGTVKRFRGRVPFQETRMYVQKILSFLNDKQ